MIVLSCVSIIVSHNCNTLESDDRCGAALIEIHFLSSLSWNGCLHKPLPASQQLKESRANGPCVLFTVFEMICPCTVIKEIFFFHSAFISAYKSSVGSERKKKLCMDHHASGKELGYD